MNGDNSKSAREALPEIQKFRPIFSGPGTLVPFHPRSMPTVTFTANLRRHLPCPPAAVGGATVREALDAVFAENPRLRGYVVDEHGALRQHMAIYVDGTPILDRKALGDAVGPDAQIFVMQALSGG